MKITLTILFFFVLSLNSFAQDAPCACCSNNHNQFDFWLGEWTVYDTENNIVGTNKIIKKYENCLIQENWVSEGKNRGTSYNYYDPNDSTWNQLWIDNQGTILNLKGTFSNGAMVLKSELLKGKKVDWYYNRITWSTIDSGYVKQTWDILDQDDNLLTTVFNGIYKPKEK